MEREKKRTRAENEVIEEEKTRKKNGKRKWVEKREMMREIK